MNSFLFILHHDYVWYNREAPDNTTKQICLQEFQKYVCDSLEDSLSDDQTSVERESILKTRNSARPCHYYQSQPMGGSHFLTSSKLESNIENKSIHTTTGNIESIDTQYCSGCENRLIFKRTRSCANCGYIFCTNCCSQQILNEGKEEIHIGDERN